MYRPLIALFARCRGVRIATLTTGATLLFMTSIVNEGIAQGDGKRLTDVLVSDRRVQKECGTYVVRSCTLPIGSLKESQ